MTKVNYIIFFLFTSIIASCQTTASLDEEYIDIENDQRSISDSVILDTIPFSYSWKEKYQYERALINTIHPPKNYSRIEAEQQSFTSWLRHLPLSKDDKVHLFNGEEKYNQSAQFKVLDIDIGDKDLQQCADAVMRLRAEYLFSNKQFSKIHFNYTNGVNISFSKWSSGFYPSLKGNKVVWIASSNNKSYKSFKKYMINIFMYAGTASLEKEMKSISLNEIESGDVFIKGGFPGHAVIVLDVAINKETKDKVFLLAQSYMPAQNIHILQNPTNNDLSPWYRVDEINEVIETPEWTFNANQLKRFVE